MVNIKKILAIGAGTRLRRNFLHVASANVFAQLLAILATPLLTRLFLPSDYAALAIFTTILSIVASACTWRFDWVIPNARTKAMEACLFMLGAMVLCGISIGVVPVLVLLTYTHIDTGLSNNLGFFAYLLFPVILFATGLNTLFSAWFVRHGDLRPVSKAAIRQSLANVTIALTAGVTKLGAIGLVGALVLSTWLGLIFLITKAGKQVWMVLRRVTKKRLRVAMARYGQTATWSTVSSVVNTLSFSAPVLLLALFYSPAQVGWYAMMHRLLAAPISVVTSALGQSFWSEAADLARNKKVAQLNSFYKATTLRLVWACLPIVLICLVGPFVVGPILGADEWQGAGEVLFFMAPMFIGAIMFSPTTHLIVLGKQHWMLVADLLRLILVGVAIFFAAYIDLSFTIVVALISGSNLLGHIMVYILHLKAHHMACQHGP